MLSSKFHSQITHYINALVRWNRVFNLTAINDPKAIYTRHILDSLSISPYLHGPSILDVGTGAGLPGIPLALAHPDYSFVLLDSRGKKVRFLLQMISELGLSNVTAVKSRVEDYDSTLKFDSIVTRALSSAGPIVLNCQRLLAQRGRYLIMKGRYPHSEETELQAMPNITYTITPLNVPGLPEERHLIEVWNQ